MPTELFKSLNIFTIKINLIKIRFAEKFMIFQFYLIYNLVKRECNILEIFMNILISPMISIKKIYLAKLLS